MIIVTGAAGFIGSCMVAKLNQEGYTDLILVDDFSREDKMANYQHKSFSEKVERDHFFEWVKGKELQVQFVFHLGARTDTTEMSQEIFDRLNLTYSQEMWRVCTEFSIPLVYASSAATYGGGEFGFDDNESQIPQLAPLNPYGESKQKFDEWVLKQDTHPFFWAGLKFFNVYGPNEYHKGRMASVVFHACNQIQKTGKMKLFRSHREDVPDGEQSRDFIYVKDVTAVMFSIMKNRSHSGIFNLGTGTARTFLDLVGGVFDGLGISREIEFIDTPIDIRATYQYFTEANMEKLQRAGYADSFISLEEGVKEYVEQFLIEKKYL